MFTKLQNQITGISSAHNSSIIDNFHITGIRNQVMQMITAFAFEHWRPRFISYAAPQMKQITYFQVKIDLKAKAPLNDSQKPNDSGSI